MQKVRTQVTSNFGAFGHRLCPFEDPKIIYFAKGLSLMGLLRDFLRSDYLITHSCLSTAQGRIVEYPFEESISQFVGETWTLKTPVADFLFEFLD